MRWALLGLLTLGACRARPTHEVRETKSVVVEAPRPLPPPTPVASEAPPSAPTQTQAPPAKPYDRAITRALKQVSQARGLPVLEPVKSFSLNREGLLARTKQKMEQDLPPDVLKMQGESMRAFELVPIDYDLEAGILELIGGQVAGFYDPEEKALFLLDDLEPAQEKETLPHELVHALQDQSFSIEPLLKYRPGAADLQAAGQQLVEGDAMLVGLELTIEAHADAVDVDEMREKWIKATADSPVGRKTPPILIASIVSPYTDGFSFVRDLRASGTGWSKVNAAFRDLPKTTEQILHLDKYEAREPAMKAPAIPHKALGEGLWDPLESTCRHASLSIL